MEYFDVIGLMSGTSLDGLDIAWVRFHFDGKWHFELVNAEAIPYSNDWHSKLSEAHQLDGLGLKKLDLAYGDWTGQTVRSFMDKYKIAPRLIVSHGHTIFHQPDQGLTMQIGDGYRIYRNTGIKTIFDLRSMDIAFGGQGAPLVPTGDKLLFSEYDSCLNLGGFSNISFDQNGNRIAFDISPVNTVLNFLANRINLDYDKNGDIAASGQLIPALLQDLNNLEYYRQHPPKSLGIEWVNEHILPLMQEDRDTKDLLHTFCHHIADQIAYVCSANHLQRKMLVTGGGAKNKFLIDLIRERTKGNPEIEIPEESIIDFKEAIIFAFLGLLRDQREINCLNSVTGATISSSSGIIIENNIKSNDQFM